MCHRPYNGSKSNLDYSPWIWKVMSRIQTTQLFCLDLQGVQHQSLKLTYLTIFWSATSTVEVWLIVGNSKYLIKVKKSLSSWLKEAIVHHWQELEQNHSLQETHHNLLRCNNKQRLSQSDYYQENVHIQYVISSIWTNHQYCQFPVMKVLNSHKGVHQHHPS